ncbi:MAG TPA: hypothetical protein VD993_13015 [Chitinophagaceae bacterium]|nr:hypothetical protein [Chitinophagaceae bacterium]
MKRSSMYVSGLLLASSTILFSCEKTDLVPENPETVEKKKDADCEVTAFRYNANTGSGTTNQYVFKRQNDPSTGRLSQIITAVYQGGAITSTLTFDVRWANNSIVFLKAGSATDTVLVASLNAQGKPIDVVAGNAPDANYLPTSFEYNNTRLSAMKITLGSNLLVSRFAYDGKGNCTSIQDDGQGSMTPGRVEYTYGNKKADRQLYLDEPRIFSWNTFSLLQFSGLFPELQPAQLRTGVKVFWANNYKVYDVNLVNHHVEGGNLQRYEVSFPGSSVTIPYFSDFACEGAQ